MRRIYLNELSQNSLGLGVLKLIMEQESTAPEKAKTLIAQAKSQLTQQQVQQNLIDLIETIIVYKLPTKSREEIEAMLGLSEIRQTKVYQEALQEGEQRGEKRGEQRGEQKAKLEAIPGMARYGLSVDAIAEILNLPVETVTEILENLDRDDQ